MPMSLSAMLIASPMPRVPPVTIATRAMNSSSVMRRKRLGRRQPTFKLALHQLLQHGHAFGRIVEAIEQGELLPAVRPERLATTNAEFLERFKTVGGESGRRDGYARHSVLWISGERGVGCWLEPFGSAEPRLKRD